jgi:long-chain acyl-CoA synthetase
LQALGNKLVWSKVQDGFGGRNRVIISGGSALAGGLETFFETAGVTICVGYGLTECSPLLSFRRSDANLVTAGCAGKACIDTEVRVVDPESKATNAGPRPSLPVGQAGVVLGKGPQVMKGYYKNEEATQQAVDRYGWFDTGDLGRINPATGDLILTGRAKDTIVLSNGENIEPTPIEDAILGESPLVDQIMLTGSEDGRRLVAVAVLNPTEVGAQGFLDAKVAKELQDAHDKANDPKCTEEDYAEACKVLNQAAVELRKNDALKKQLLSDMQQATKTGFRKWEQVGDVYMTLQPFAMANGQLTQSYKVKRAAVQACYNDALSKF